MDLTLPQRVYLMSYRPEKEEFPVADLQFRGQRLQAAALAALVEDGLVGAEGGKAVRLGTEAPADEVLAGVWEQVRADKPTGWLRLVHNKAYAAEAPVRAQLMAAGVIREPEHPRRGLLGSHMVVVSEPEQVDAMREAARGPVLGDADPATVPFGNLATAVICTEGEVSVLFDGKEGVRTNGPSRPSTRCSTRSSPACATRCSRRCCPTVPWAAAGRDVADAGTP